MVGLMLFTSGLAATLIGVLGLAIRRSIRRQACARLRDRLVDATRTGELDVADWRVIGLIDWFDHVAATGHTDIPGRHALDLPRDRDPADSLARSLATTLLPLGTTGLFDSSWPESPQVDVGSDLWTDAVNYRERHHQRLRYLPWRPSQPRTRIHITGHPKPDDGLVPLTGWSPAEEIFAVAGPVR